jgi:hypothetical protein
MPRLVCIIALLSATGCGGTDDGNLSPFTKCGPAGECPAGSSCLATECVEDGSLEFGDTCLLEPQCGPGLACHNFICKYGCSRMFTVDDCPEGQWCKPIDGSDPLVGRCGESECDPGLDLRCPDDSACVAFGEAVGGCLPYCEYGYATDTYQDSCVDPFGVDLSCQPVGLDSVPICLPSGDPDSGPAVGEPGCSGVYRPCGTEAVCIDAVCRQLCRPGQTSPCGPGETCVPHAGRSDLFTCQAK